jgi:chemotaxis protein histidine kinase CheA
MKYADLFEREAGAHIAALRALVVALEAPGDETEPGALLGRLRNESHGLAGVAAVVELDPVCRLMRAVEEVSVTLGRAAVAPSAALVEAIRAAVDAADTLGSSALEGRDPPESLDIDGLVAAVEAGAALS